MKGQCCCVKLVLILKTMPKPIKQVDEDWVAASKQGSKLNKGCQSQVLPATSSDMVSRDRELISAQHDRAYTSTQQQGFQDPEGFPGSKPTSFRSLDSASQINKTGSMTSYDQLQGVQSGYADNMQIPEGGQGAMANWSHDNVSADRLDMSSSQSNGRHTHQE